MSLSDKKFYTIITVVMVLAMTMWFLGVFIFDEDEPTPVCPEGTEMVYVNYGGKSTYTMCATPDGLLEPKWED